MAYKRISPTPVIEGGTGTLTNVNHGVLLGAGTSAINNVAVGATNTVLLAQTAADPIWGTVPNAALTNSTITVTGSNGITIGGSPVALGGTLTIAGGGGFSVTAINNASSPYTVLAADEFISANVTAGVISVLLPNAPTTGRAITIKDKVGLAATSNISVTTVGGVVTIDGATTFAMNTAYQSITVVFDGSNYSIA